MAPRPPAQLLTCTWFYGHQSLPLPPTSAIHLALLPAPATLLPLPQSVAGRSLRRGCGTYLPAPGGETSGSQVRRWLRSGTPKWPPSQAPSQAPPSCVPGLGVAPRHTPHPTHPHPHTATPIPPTTTPPGSPDCVPRLDVPLAALSAPLGRLPALTNLTLSGVWLRGGLPLEWVAPGGLLRWAGPPALLPCLPAPPPACLCGRGAALRGAAPDTLTSSCEPAPCCSPARRVHAHPAFLPYPHPQ